MPQGQRPHRPGFHLRRRAEARGEARRPLRAGLQEETEAAGLADQGDGRHRRGGEDGQPPARRRQVAIPAPERPAQPARELVRPRIVIAGAGFGGLTCARALKHAPVDVLLVDRNNFHLFTPLLYQVASALLNPSDIAYPIRTVFRHSPNVRFRAAEVTGVDFPRRVVTTAEGAEFPYDHL